MSRELTRKQLRRRVKGYARIGKRLGKAVPSVKKTGRYRSFETSLLDFKSAYREGKRDFPIADLRELVVTVYTELKGVAQLVPRHL